MRLSRYCLAAAAVGLISLSVILTDVPRAVAQTKTVFVEVVNPSSRPVPTVAQGTTQVAGSVSAQQTGSWTVGISNTVGNPVIVREMEFAAREPFQHSIQGNLSEFEEGVVRELVVPAGKRLVIEHVSCSAAVPPGQKAICHIVTTAGGQEGFHFLTMSEQGNFVSNDQFRATQTMRVYADPDTLIKAVGRRNAGTGSAIFDFTVSGYLVDVP